MALKYVGGFFLLAYDSGLGSKNPQGFGMVEVIRQRTIAGDREASSL